MEKLSRSVDRFCYKHPKLGIAGLMRYIVMVNALVFMLDMFTRGACSNALSFKPYFIFYEFELWRLVTFLAVPASGYSDMWSIFWFAISSMCYFFIGSALEQRWGTTKFTVFYGLGVLLNLVGGLLLSVLAMNSIINPYYMLSNLVTMDYVNLSLFFSIATLYPNLQFYFMLIIPMKAKWMGFLSGAMFAYEVGYQLFFGHPALAFVPLLAIFNYFLFFSQDISAFMFRKTKGGSAPNPRSQAIDLKKAQKQVQKQKGYLHKCTICGKTDVSDPDIEFRYCSKCTGYHCYCMDHINDHEHKT